MKLTSVYHISLSLEVASLQLTPDFQNSYIRQILPGQLSRWGNFFTDRPYLSVTLTHVRARNVHLNDAHCTFGSFSYSNWKSNYHFYFFVLPPFGPYLLSKVKNTLLPIMPSLTIYIFVKMWVYGYAFIMHLELSISKIFPYSQDKIRCEISTLYCFQEGRLGLLCAAASKIGLKSSVLIYNLIYYQFLITSNLWSISMQSIHTFRSVRI